MLIINGYSKLQLIDECKLHDLPFNGINKTILRDRICMHYEVYHYNELNDFNASNINNLAGA